MAICEAAASCPHLFPISREEVQQDESGAAWCRVPDRWIRRSGRFFFFWGGGMSSQLYLCKDLKSLFQCVTLCADCYGGLQIVRIQIRNSGTRAKGSSICHVLVPNRRHDGRTRFFEMMVWPRKEASLSPTPLMHGGSAGRANVHVGFALSMESMEGYRGTRILLALRWVATVRFYQLEGDGAR